MKEHFETIIAKAGKGIELSKQEREKMRFVLSEYAAMKPLTAPAAPSRTILHYLGAPRAFAGALIVVLVSGGGLAYAAEGTLPGQALYSVKIGVSEPLETLFTPVAQSAAWHMTLAERRLDEAAVLADRGELGTSTEITLADNFTEHAKAAKSNFGSEPTATNESLGSSERFDTRLDAYASVLAKVDDKSHKHETKLLQKAIRTQAMTHQARAAAVFAPASAAKSAALRADTSLDSMRASERRSVFKHAVIDLHVDAVDDSASEDE